MLPPHKSSTFKNSLYSIDHIHFSYLQLNFLKKLLLLLSSSPKLKIVPGTWYLFRKYMSNEFKVIWRVHWCWSDVAIEWSVRLSFRQRGKSEKAKGRAKAGMLKELSKPSWTPWVRGEHCQIKLKLGSMPCSMSLKI